MNGGIKRVGAIALSYPPTVRVRATVKLSAAFFHDESSITKGGVRKCNSTHISTCICANLSCGGSKRGEMKSQ